MLLLYRLIHHNINCLIDTDNMFPCSGLHLSSVHEVSQLCWGALSSLWTVPWHRRPARSCGALTVRPREGKAIETNCADCILNFFLFKGRISQCCGKRSRTCMCLSRYRRVSLSNRGVCFLSYFLHCVCVYLFRRKGGSLGSSRKS